MKQSFLMNRPNLIRIRKYLSIILAVCLLFPILSVSFAETTAEKFVNEHFIVPLPSGNWVKQVGEDSVTYYSSDYYLLFSPSDMEGIDMNSVSLDLAYKTVINGFSSSATDGKIEIEKTETVGVESRIFSFNAVLSGMPVTSVGSLVLVDDQMMLFVLTSAAKDITEIRQDVIEMNNGTQYFPEGTAAFTDVPENPDDGESASEGSQEPKIVIVSEKTEYDAGDFTLTLDTGTPYMEGKKESGETLLTIYPAYPVNGDESSSFSVIWSGLPGFSGIQYTAEQKQAFMDSILSSAREEFETLLGKDSILDFSLTERGSIAIGGKEADYVCYSMTLDLSSLGAEYEGFIFNVWQQGYIVFGDFGIYCFLLTSSDSSETIAKYLRPLLDTICWK